MGNTKTEINYDILDEVIANLQAALEDTMIVSEGGQIDVSDIDMNDIFVNSTGDSAEKLKLAYHNVKGAYDLVNTLISTALNMLTDIKTTYQKADEEMSQSVSTIANSASTDS